jgi:hypothetical protein
MILLVCISNILAMWGGATTTARYSCDLEIAGAEEDDSFAGETQLNKHWRDQSVSVDIGQVSGSY